MDGLQGSRDVRSPLPARRAAREHGRPGHRVDGARSADRGGGGRGGRRSAAGPGEAPPRADRGAGPAPEGSSVRAASRSNHSTRSISRNARRRSGPGWPFHLEGVAPGRRRVQVPDERPARPRSSRPSAGSHRARASCRPAARARSLRRTRGERRPCGSSPGSASPFSTDQDPSVLLREERTAGMTEEDLEAPSRSWKSRIRRWSRAERFERSIAGQAPATQNAVMGGTSARTSTPERTRGSRSATPRPSAVERPRSPRPGRTPVTRMRRDRPTRRDRPRRSAGLRRTRPTARPRRSSVHRRQPRNATSPSLQGRRSTGRRGPSRRTNRRTPGPRSSPPMPPRSFASSR